MNVIRRHCGGIEAVHKFIAAIRSHPAIWVHSGEQLEVDSANDDESFQEIIKKLGWEDRVSVENARNAWTHLRAQYSKERANRSECSKTQHGDDHNDCGSPAWEFFDDMAFMDGVEMRSIVEEDNDSAKKAVIISCAISHCPSTGDSKIDGRPVIFFDVPSKADADLWKKWESAIPTLSCASSTGNLKVCELHFIKGAPSGESPVPVLRLHNETDGESRISRKRKASRSPSPVVKNAEAGSLDSVLQAVADSAIKREMELLGETDATQPLRLPSSIKTSDTNGQNTSISKPKIVRLSMKALGSLTGGKLSTNYKLVRASSGVASLPSETSKFIVDSNGSKTKVFKVIKASTGVSSVLKKATNSESNVPQTKTIEEALSSLVASAPSVSEVDGTEERPDADVHCASPSTSGETSHAEVTKLADASKTSDNEKKAGPSNSSPHKSPTGAENQRMTLMSVLQQCLGSSADLKDAEPSQANEVLCGSPSISSSDSIGPKVACQKCANDLPALRRSLGRLESRVDSMITMVRTLCARQATIEASRKQVLSNADMAYKTPAIVVRPRSVQSGAATLALKSGVSQQRSAITVTSNGASSGNKTTPIVNQCGRMATLVRVKSGAGSTFKLVRSSSKLLVGARMQKSTGTESAAQPIGKLQAVGKEHAKILQQPDRSLTYLHKAVIRSLLLFRGPFFTIADFRLKGPAVVRTVGEDKLRECLAKLLNDGLLRRIDDHLDLTDPEAAFEKERLKSKLIKLSEYGITKEQYENALEQVFEKTELMTKR
ncbi:unnamed protein product [Toxocara canis]|uniref:MADF domain-containing protein n=1 Tax=Toxocara canis TaxID=6265 RepID=A0A183V180_TOXCA|nr:unnamed protein product [Toxocara canis]